MFHLVIKSRLRIIYSLYCYVISLYIDILAIGHSILEKISHDIIAKNLEFKEMFLISI